MYNFKVFLLVLVCSIFAEARRLDIWKEGSSDVDKQSDSRQVCQDIKEERHVDVQELLNKDGIFFPTHLTTLSCKTHYEGGDAIEVSDPSVICKTKEELRTILEFNDNEIPIAAKKVKVGVDCVAVKI